MPRVKVDCGEGQVLRANGGLHRYADIQTELHLFTQDNKEEATGRIYLCGKTWLSLHTGEENSAHTRPTTSTRSKPKRGTASKSIKPDEQIKQNLKTRDGRGSSSGGEARDRSHPWRPAEDEIATRASERRHEAIASRRMGLEPGTSSEDRSR